MGKVPLAKPRSIVSEIPGGLQIIIAMKSLSFFYLLAIFLCFWVFTESTALQQLISGNPKPRAPYPIWVVWLVGWTVGGAYLLLVLLYMVAGHERVVITESSLVIRREIGSLGRSQKYDVALVKDLRVSKGTMNTRDFLSSMQFWALGGESSIAFDYGFKTFRFGVGLDEAEVKHLVATIKQRFKSL